MAACCVAILAALSIAHGGSLNFVQGVPALVRTLSEFSIGALIYRAHSGGAALLIKRAGILTILFMGLATITRQDFFTVGAFGCLVFYGVNTTGVASRLLNSRPAVALGNWSYSIYLSHAPTHYAVMVAFAASGHPINDLSSANARLLVLAAALGVVAIAAVSYEYFETPARRLLISATMKALPDMRPIGSART